MREGIVSHRPAAHRQRTNAQPAALIVADWVSDKAGGAGAAREFCDLILRAKGYRIFVDTEKGLCEWRRY